MAKPAPTRKLGRNDPCHCGSGRKYKECHQPQEEAYRSEQLRLRQAQDTLLPKIVEAAQSVPEQFPPAFERFWDAKYTIDQMGELDEHEDRGAERFLTWFAFDFRSDQAPTLVEQLLAAARNEGFALEPAELTLLERWQSVRLRPYIVDEIRKGKGVLVRDMLTDSPCELADSHAAKRLEVGEIIVGHLTPADTAPGASAPTYYLAGAAAQLTSDTAEKLVEFAEIYLADLRRREPDATWADLINARSEVLNHFVTALPHEEPNPTLLDEIILQGRTSMQLTVENVRDLLGRNHTDEPKQQ